jgi:UDP-galactopyranose mutase|tara:strand:+ start:1647 stop:2843 length:1197 start_codon:yes stop_codon:yes gene_type:complete
MKKILIIGGGFAGCVNAHALSLTGEYEITLVEKSSELGAGVRTYFWGGHPYTFGPRHFLTKDQKLYDFFNKYIPMRDCSEHKYLTYVEGDDQFYSMPLSYDDIENMPDKKEIYKQLDDIKHEKNKAKPENLEDFWISSIGSNLYKKVVENYNKKMWMVNDNKIFKSFSWSTKGDPIKKGKREAFDSEVISAYPIALDGYNKYFDISVKGVKHLLLNTTVKINDLKKLEVEINGEIKKFDHIISSISPDDVVGNIFGELKYIGRDLHKIVLPMKDCFPEDIYFLYYANKEKFTRIVEYKRFTKYDSPNTLIGLEIPSKNGKFYPMPTEDEQDKARQYHNYLPPNFHCVGRNGTYRYSVDIDDCIEQAFFVADLIKNSKWENAVPMEKHRMKNFSSMGKQ